MSISEFKHMPEPARRVEIFTGAGRRRNWSSEEKAAIVAESYGEGASVCAVARRHGLDAAAAVHLAAPGASADGIPADDVHGGGRGGAGGGARSEAPGSPPVDRERDRVRDRCGRGAGGSGHEPAGDCGDDPGAHGGA